MKEKAMSAPGVGEVFVPQFACLTRCLLIDASFQSRGEVLKDVKASQLFEELIEAKSLSDGLRLIQQVRFDACFVGPSISLERTKEFMVDAQSRTISDDCAFVSILKEHNFTQRSVLEEIAHGFVRWPSTKRDFFENSVIAILKANKGTVWPGVKLGGQGELMVSENGIWVSFKRDDTVTNMAAVLEPPLEIRPDETSISVLCDRLGNMTSKRGLEEILRQILQSSGQGADMFGAYFQKAIQEWREELEYNSTRDATKNLRKKLLAFKYEEPSKST